MSLPYKLGSNGPEIVAWQEWFHRMYRSYAPPIDGYYGNDEVRAVEELQRRLGLPVTGEFDAATAEKAGYTAAIPQPPAAKEKPFLFTVHGTGMPDPLGAGLPADTARRVLDLYRWQPIGNYPAAPFPMWPSVMQGVTELIHQINSKPGAFSMAGYSQGAIVVGQVLKHHIMSPTGSLRHRLKDVRKVVFWGNPMRQQGIAHDDHWIHETAQPDTHGILDDRLEGLEDAPFEVRDYAHEKDMYAAVRDEDKDEYKIAVAKIVMRAEDFYKGPNSILSQLLELGQRPLLEGIALAGSLIDAGVFFSNNAHGYNINPAVDFLRS